MDVWPVKKCLFALYQGDEFIANGTVEELAAIKGVKVSAIYMYSSIAYQRRVSGKKSIKVINLGTIDESEGY